MDGKLECLFSEKKPEISGFSSLRNKPFFLWKQVFVPKKLHQIYSAFYQFFSWAILNHQTMGQIVIPNKIKQRSSGQRRESWLPLFIHHQLSRSQQKLFTSQKNAQWPTYDHLALTTTFIAHTCSKWSFYYFSLFGKRSSSPSTNSQQTLNITLGCVRILVMGVELTGDDYPNFGFWEFPMSKRIECFFWPF